MEHILNIKTMAVASSAVLAYGIWKVVTATDEYKEEQFESLQGQPSTVKLDKIIACGNVQEEIKQYIEFLKHPEMFLNLKISMTSGCLLVGPSGSGKRTISRAIAGEANVPLFEISDAVADPYNPGWYLLICNGRKEYLRNVFAAIQFLSLIHI